MRETFGTKKVIPETERTDKSDKTLCHCDDRLTREEHQLKRQMFQGLQVAGKKFQDGFTSVFPTKYQNLHENMTKDLKNKYPWPKYHVNKK